MVGALWLPWHRSGSRSRNAFDLSTALDRLDLEPAYLGDLWEWLVPLVPIFGALAWTARVLRRNRLLVMAVAPVTVVVGFPALAALAISELRNLGEWSALLGLITVLVGLWRLRRQSSQPHGGEPQGGLARSDE